MITVSVADAKNRFSELVARAEAGEEIAVTRHGKPVARIIAAEVVDIESRSAAVDAIFRNLAELGRGVRLDGDLKQIARDGLD
jgi:prevent-host-death family protein